MKKLVFSMLAMAAMVSCTSESDPINDITDGDKAEIKMTAGVLNIVTKSAGAINGNEAEITDVAFWKKDGAENATIDWTDSPETFQATIAATSGEVTFLNDSKPYYPAKENEYAHIIGYHPITGGTPGASTDADKITYTITGSEDILYAAEKKASKTTKDTPLKPEFKHLLTQLKIKIVGDAAALAAWGDITSIAVKNADKALTLNLKDGTIDVSPTQNQGDLELIKASGISSYPAIPSTAQEVAYAMVLPKTTQYTLVIKTSNFTTGRDVAISIPASLPNRPENATLAGESYTITLTFSASEVKTSATVDEWTSVDGGSGTVD